MKRSTFARVLGTAAVAVALGSAEAHAHGSTMSPASRAYACRYLDRDSEPCAHAWRTSPQALYDWMGVLIARADGRHRELIPDGQLCSAGDPRFAAFDRPSARWPATAIRPGRQTIRYVNNAPHATLYYRFYMTKDGYDPARPLRWDDLEPIHDSGRRPAVELETFSVDVPARSGRHLLYVIWQRSDSPEAFYACSDVVFDGPGALPAEPPLPDESLNQPGGGGGGGQGEHGGRHGAHRGHGGGEGGRAVPSPRGLTSRRIVLRRKVDDDWGAGYCATVTVTNRSRRARAWKASMRLPHRVDSSWSAVARQRAGRLHVRGVSWNRTLRPGARTSFGFCATR